jgi:hypothetical protein
MLACPETGEMNGHALTAWLALLYRRIGSEADETRQVCSKRREASYLIIVLDKTTLFVAAARYARALRNTAMRYGM